MNTWSGWEAAVLQAIGAPITAANIAFLDAWNAAEQSGASFNPLNTTQPAPGSSSYNGAGVQIFPDASTGASATAQTLQNGYYPTIVAALRSGNPLAFVGPALQQELAKWGTGSAWLSNLTGGASGSWSGGGNGAALGAAAAGAVVAPAPADWPPQIKLFAVSAIVAALAFTFFSHVKGQSQGVVGA